MSIFDLALPPLTAPVMVVDQTAMRANLSSLVEAAHGKPIRLASKSIRVRGILEKALETPGVRGVLTYSLAEAAWLVSCGIRDVLVAYPSVDMATMRQVAADEVLRANIALMVDDAAHVKMASKAAEEVGGELRLAADIDCSLYLRSLLIGVHRSGIRNADDAGRLADVIAATPRVRLVGAMFYEAQVAGVPDASPVHRLMKRRSMEYLSTYRSKVCERLSAHGELEFVNGGGTGSVHLTQADPCVTDIAAGSGLFSPTLFDGYDALTTSPACYFVLPVVRKPRENVVGLYSGGYIASGPPGKSRVPSPVHPSGLKYVSPEGAGEVQTPLRGAAADNLALGDGVWFRHAKAGELAERFDEVLIVSGGELTETLPTYRGEGKNFG